MSDGTFGGEIRWKRQQLEMLIEELAAKVGLSGGYVSKLEMNRIDKPSDTIIFRIAKELRLDPIDLKAKLSRKSQHSPATDVTTARAQPAAPLSENKVMPLGHDFQGTLLDLRPTARLKDVYKNAYVELAEAYVSVGYAAFTQVPEEELLDIQSGVAAYYAAASIYAALHMPEAHDRVRYRIVRTYQGLVMTDRARPEERLTLLYRAGEMCDQIIAREEQQHRQQEDSVADISNASQTDSIRLTQKTRLGEYTREFMWPACLSVSATINGLIVKEYKTVNRQFAWQKNSDNSDALSSAQSDGLLWTAKKRREQATAIYQVIIDRLQAKRSDVKNKMQGENLGEVLEVLAEAQILAAINMRGRAHNSTIYVQFREEADAIRQMNEESASLFKESIRTVQERIKLAQRNGESLAKQALLRHQLSRCHREFGRLHGLRWEEDCYIQTLWQYRLSKEIRPQIQSLETPVPDRYLRGDQNIDDLMEITLRESTLNNALPASQDGMAEQEDIDRILLIEKTIETLRDENAFETLNYPIDYPNQSFHIPE